MIDKIKNYLDNNPKVEKVLKKDHRSYVFIFTFENKKYVYKEPIEKNTRKWQKILSIFRGTESKREFYQMKKINSLPSLKTAKPVFYEKKYLVYEYLEGRKPKIEETDLVVKKLKEIHSLGYLHGDSHLANFLINNGEIYIIDSKFQKNKYGKFGEIFEMMYLEKSLNTKINYEKNNFYYKGAMALRKYLNFFSKLKNIIRGR